MMVHSVPIERVCPAIGHHSTKQIGTLLVSYDPDVLGCWPIIFIPNDQDEKAAIFTVIDVTNGCLPKVSTTCPLSNNFRVLLTSLYVPSNI
jgi:hypothetical protein